MVDLEVEKFQFQGDGEICKLPISEMEQLVQHVGLESKQYKGKSKLAMSKIFRVKVDDELGKNRKQGGICNKTPEFYCWKMEQALVKLEERKTYTPATTASKPKEGNIDVKTLLR